MHNDGGKELSAKKKVTIYVNRNSNVIRNPPLLWISIKKAKETHEDGCYEILSCFSDSSYVILSLLLNNMTFLLKTLKKLLQR